MAQERKSRIRLFLIGLPVLSNIVSFIIFAPLFVPGRTATPTDYQRAGMLVGSVILVIEVIAIFFIALSLRGEGATLKSLINFQSGRIQSYLIVGVVALLPTLVLSWIYQLGQAQAGVVSELARLTKGEIAFWYVLTPFTAAFLEETIWRGYAIPRTKGVWRSLLLTSLSFALFHGITNPLGVVAAFGQGLVWGWNYQRTDSPIPGMVLHFISRYAALLF
jgi:membrane protease YdiL (CAAX protease family)